jgi:hypothetical protein
VLSGGILGASDAIKGAVSLGLLDGNTVAAEGAPEGNVVVEGAGVASNALHDTRSRAAVSNDAIRRIISL